MSEKCSRCGAERARWIGRIGGWLCKACEKHERTS